MSVRGADGSATMAAAMDLPRTADAVIIGGGVVGCSIAYNLARRGVRDVLVLERETVGSGTTSKAAGGIRAQFPTETEIRFSLESIRVFERFEEEFGVDPGYRKIGYLFLISEADDLRGFEQRVLSSGASAPTSASSRRARRRRWCRRCGSTISSRRCGAPATAWRAPPR